MWQTEWSENRQPSANGEAPTPSLLPHRAVDRVYQLQWNEHCVECAIPDCYQCCPLYHERRDRKCARFKNGISPNPHYPGLFPFGADIEFRRWGKLEAKFGGGGGLTPGEVRLLGRMDRFLLGGLGPVSSSLRWLSPHYRLNGAYAVLRENFCRTWARFRKGAFDEFVVEAWNLAAQSLPMVIECWQGEPKFRTSIVLAPGRNLCRIPASSMNIDLYGSAGLVRVYPDHDAEAHVVFSWLDFVRYGRSSTYQRPSVSLPHPPKAETGSKVKCVIWDLDNTMWDGVLGEQNPTRVRLRPQVLGTILALDEKGILQSIASKNDHDAAWQVLERLGISHLFLSPAINWDPKSANVRRIIQELNLGVEACAFIDDLAFERAEVEGQLPGIRTYSDLDVSTLLERNEFDVPVTKESRHRRLSYVTESERKQEARAYGADYEAFLRTCNMEADLFTPSNSEHIERCLELLHRSNQLNLSTYRYPRQEFERLLDDKDVISICTSCRDRFGDYGIVGFASLRRCGKELFLTDFVLSCRIAQKKLENAWFKQMMALASDSGYASIHARYIQTPRNGVLWHALLEVGFIETEKTADGCVLALDCEATPPAADIVSLQLNVTRELPPPLASVKSQDDGCESMDPIQAEQA